MISTRQQLSKVLLQDEVKYLRNSFKGRVLDALFRRENDVLWRFVKTMRYCDYYTTNKNKSFFHAIMYFYYFRKYNILCVKLGLIIGAGVFDEGLQIYHTGNIVVNGYAKVGKNCKLHGSNCIGNSHTDDDVPTIGDDVRIGVGAKIFGKIYIANRVTVAAGAIVTKSCYEEGAVLAGVPARIVRHGEA